MSYDMDQIRAELKRRVTHNTFPNSNNPPERLIDEVKQQINRTTNLSISEAIKKLTNNSDGFVSARRADWPTGEYIMCRTIRDLCDWTADMLFYVTEHTIIIYSPDIEDITTADWYVSKT